LGKHGVGFFDAVDAPHRGRGVVDRTRVQFVSPRIGNWRQQQDPVAEGGEFAEYAVHDAKSEGVGIW